MRRLMLVVVACLCAGCGYTTGSLLPSEYRTVGVQPFKNSISFVNEGARATYIPLLETKVRQAVMDRFQYDGHLRLTNNVDTADLVLRGELTSFEREELRLTDNRDVQEYRIRITVSMVMFDNIKNQPMWEEPSFSGEATYFTTGPQAKSESDAVQDALTDLSRRVTERTLEAW